VAWLRETALGHAMISAGDLDLLHVTDDIEEVVRIIDAADELRSERDPAHRFYS
jgi:predicted Rossmann-fold nucleotide-binding protein